MTREQADAIAEAVMHCRNTARDAMLPERSADPRALREVDAAAFQDVLNLINEAVL